MGFAEFKKLKSVEGKGKLFTLFKSVNLSQVSISGLPAEQSRAYIFMLERNNKLYPFIYLYFPALNKGRFFAYEEGGIEIKREEEVREEALDYVQSMGFIMEEIDLVHLSENELKELKKTLPFYYEDLKKFKKFMESIEGTLYDEEEEEEIEVEAAEEEEEEVEVEAEEEEEEVEVEIQEPEEEEEGIPEETKYLIKNLIEKYGLGRIPQPSAQSENPVEVIEEVEQEVEEAEVVEEKKLPPHLKHTVARFLASG